MAFPNSLPFRLAPYAGSKGYTICPNCERRSFTRYLNTETGELLPDDFGWCNHQVSCGKHTSPYQQQAGEYSYAKQLWLKERRGAGAERIARQVVKPAHISISTPKQLAIIPLDIYQASLNDKQYERNAFAKLLYEHLGVGAANELLKQFRVGTSSHWPGACVFWVIDEHERVRGGKVMLYGPDGHRVKQPKSCITWVHAALSNKLKRERKSLPSWLTEYENATGKGSSLFGLPQFCAAPRHKTVAIVESPKTAILATAFFPQYTWLATMGLSNLTEDRLVPLRGRRIVLWPDANALSIWQTAAIKLRRLGFNIQVSERLEQIVTEEERQRGFDLADVFLKRGKGYPPNWDKKM